MILNLHTEPEVRIPCWTTAVLGYSCRVQLYWESWEITVILDILNPNHGVPPIHETFILEGVQQKNVGRSTTFLAVSEGSGRPKRDR